MYDLSVCKCSSGFGAVTFAGGGIARCCLTILQDLFWALRLAASFAETIVGTDLARPRFQQQLLAGTTSLASLELHRKKGRSLSCALFPINRSCTGHSEITSLSFSVKPLTAIRFCSFGVTTSSPFEAYLTVRGHPAHRARSHRHRDQAALLRFLGSEWRPSRSCRRSPRSPFVTSIVAWAA
jgi:hypothetical protein